MFKQYPILIPTIGHGSTDLLENPILTLQTHLLTFLFCQSLPIFHRKVILISSSIYHISKDINIIPSFGLHCIWLRFPIISQIYLSFFHTPLHYYNLYMRDDNLFKKQLPFGIMSSLVLAYNFNLYYKLNMILGEFWWISPILSHIMLTDIFNKDQKYLK